MIRFALVLLMISIPLSAQAAGSKYLNLLWPAPEKVTAEDFQPYSQNPTHQHNRQWDDDGWQPAHWVNGGLSPDEVAARFFASGVLVEEDMNCDDIPTIKVGEPFLHLSYREQNRIAAFMDYAYGLTANSSGGSYFLTYRRRADVIGVYSPTYGLQIH